jgi:UDP-N-acetylmuramate dehydrogenase
LTVLLNPSMKILENISLKPYNTFGIDASAKYFTELLNEDDAMSFLTAKQHQDGNPLFILGGGSNILFSKDFEGTVVKVSTKGINLAGEDDESVVITVNAGELWDNVVKYCVEQGWGGLENLSLIPGNAGTSPVQNIGAYGAEMKDVLHSVEAIHLVTREKRLFTPADCKLDYRESVFKGPLKDQYMILKVSFMLSKKPVLNLGYAQIREELDVMKANPSLLAVREAVIRIRRRKLPDPAEIGNAGSFFKNPVISEEKFIELKDRFPAVVFYIQNKAHKIPAAWMIEQCGWKGKRFGDAGVHLHQPLVLVNYGNATGKDILDLAQRIRESVFERFGIMLEQEVNVI